MKKLFLALFALLVLTLTGCEEHPRTRDNVVAHNAYWDILRLNDSTLLIVPHSAAVIPIIKHTTHDPDCPCREKGGKDE